jgi:hypothetical protein
VLLGAVVLLLICRPVSPAPAQTDEDDALILALYYADYDWDTWSRPLCDQPAEPYISADAAAVERHVAQARDAGIDALLQAWNGPTLAGNPTEPNFETLLDAADRGGLKAALLVDMTGGFLETTDDVAEALTFVRDDHSTHPAYLRVGDRPLLFFLGQDAFSVPTWEALRNRVDPDHNMIWIAEGRSTEILEIFEGLYLHNAAIEPEPAIPLSRWSSEVRLWNLEHGADRIWVATVMPGYDETLFDEEGLVRARRGGAYYREFWAAADASDADFVLIRSFNGWSYCTQIEPAEGDGETYLDLTGELAADYGAAPVATETPEPTLSPPTATLTPTLAIPDTETPTPYLPPTATPYITPTATLTPTATPYRLATPTATPRPGEVVPGGGSPTLAPLPGPSPIVRPGVVPTMTPLPRLPVEGGSRRRCSLLPLLLPAALIVLARRRQQREYAGGDEEGGRR